MKYLACFRTLSPLRQTVPAFSIVEILVAMLILSILSVGAIQLLSDTETQLIEDFADRSKSQKNEAIGSFIYDDFQNQNLTASNNPQTYVNAGMPRDLIDAGGLTLVSIVGNDSRFDGVQPACRLHADANEAQQSFTFMSGCYNRGNKTIGQLLNEMIALGIPVTVQITGGSTQCLISKPIENVGQGQISRAFVDDTSCLMQGTSLAATVLKEGAEILFPRFIAYDARKPASFNTTLVEPIGITPPGIDLEMPKVSNVIGGGVRNEIPIVDALANTPDSTVSIAVETQNPKSKLDLSVIPPDVSPRGLLGSKIILEGTITNIRTALSKLVYHAPSGFFGKDSITTTMRSGPLFKTAETKLNVIANCGNQTCGTATRFEFGTYDEASRQFTTHQYLTTVTVCGTELPTTYNGYCGSKFRFDQPDGLPNRSPESTKQCALAADSALLALTQHYPTYQPPVTTVEYFPYVRYMAKARNQRPDTITVFLYETIDRNNKDRFSLFFQFDTFDSTAGQVEFTLNNMEQGRNLTDLNDPYTFADEKDEYSPSIIGPEGLMTANVEWKRPSDGVILPLRLPDTGLNPETGEYDLKYYAQDPDNDGAVNPRLLLRNWRGLHSWNVRAVSQDNTRVEYRALPFAEGTSEPKTAIQLVVNESQRCSKVPLTP